MDCKDLASLSCMPPQISWNRWISKENSTREPIEPIVEDPNLRRDSRHCLEETTQGIPWYKIHGTKATMKGLKFFPKTIDTSYSQRKCIASYFHVTRNKSTWRTSGACFKLLVVALAWSHFHPEINTPTHQSPSCRPKLLVFNVNGDYNYGTNLTRPICVN